MEPPYLDIVVLAKVVGAGAPGVGGGAPHRAQSRTRVWRRTARKAAPPVALHAPPPSPCWSLAFLAAFLAAFLVSAFAVAFLAVQPNARNCDPAVVAEEDREITTSRHVGHVVLIRGREALLPPAPSSARKHPAVLEAEQRMPQPAAHGGDAPRAVWREVQIGSEKSHPGDAAVVAHDHGVTMTDAGVDRPRRARTGGQMGDAERAP
eukprot:gene1809-8082_t